MKKLFSVCLALLLAGCATSDEAGNIRNGVVGEEVDSICFVREINNWQELDRQSIILELTLNEYYRLDLSGACDVRDAFLGLQIHSRSGICLNEGDRINVPRDLAPACMITEMYEWIPADETM